MFILTTLSISKYSTMDYDPVKDASWSAGEKYYLVFREVLTNSRVPYLALAQTFSEIEQVSARLKITEYLTNLFRSIITLSPQDLLPTVYLSINRVRQNYQC